VSDYATGRPGALACPPAAGQPVCCITVIMQHFPACLPALTEPGWQSRPVLIHRARVGLQAAVPPRAGAR
jgi:hypothetical protein